MLLAVPLGGLMVAGAIIVDLVLLAVIILRSTGAKPRGTLRSLALGSLAQVLLVAGVCYGAFLLLLHFH